MKHYIAASMMCADVGNLAQEVRNAANAGIDLLHFDVMDGKFVPNFGFTPWMIRNLKHTINPGIPFDVHLMVENPENHVNSFLEAGADMVVIHLNTTRNIIPILKQIRMSGAKAGIALSPDITPLPLKYLLPYIDVITVMTVSPGFAGGEFLPEMVQKVKDIFGMIEAVQLPVKIEVDGNINAKTIPTLAKAGASIFVGGSSGLYRKDIDLSQAVQKLRLAADYIYQEEREVL